MSESISSDRNEPSAQLPPPPVLPTLPFDLASLIDQCVSGAIGLVGKLSRTLLWMVFRPVQLADRLVQPEFGKTFCPPLAFLALGILCGYAVMHDAFTVSAETITRLDESETGWAAWIAKTLIDDLKGLSLSTLVIRTLPTAIVIVLAAACVSRFLAGRENNSTLAAAICVVIGFKLFLRFGQGLLQLALVWFSKMGETILPSSMKFELVLQIVLYVYFAAIAYILFFAGTRFLGALIRRLNRGWLSTWPVSMGIAAGVSSLLFLGTFFAPQTAWTIASLPQIEEDLYVFKAFPLGPARLDFSDAEHVFLTSNVLVHSTTDRQVLFALPRQITFGDIAEPVECHYESEPMLDGTCLLDAGSTRIVRATWRLNQRHLLSVFQESAVPLIIQWGSVDDVMREQAQSSTIQIALDQGLLAQLHADLQLQTAETPPETVDR